MSYMIKDSFRILKNTLTAFTFIQKNNTKNQFQQESAIYQHLYKEESIITHI